MKRFIAAGILLFAVQAAPATVVISEWMYQGTDGEFIEFTNLGPAAVDMTGWSFDDDSAVAGTVSLSGLGVLEAGESGILADVAADAFVTAWGLSGVAVVGGNSANLGRNDTINLFDASNSLIDSLAYGDQTYAGTVRTQNRSGNIPASDYGYAVVQTGWALASVGDVYGSRASAGGDIASPGVAPIPEPAALLLWVIGSYGLLRRR